LLAASRHSAVIPVFIRDPGSAARERSAEHADGGCIIHFNIWPKNVWNDLGAPLVLLTGDPADLIPKLVAAAGASAVYWNRRYDPALQSCDADLKRDLQSRGIAAESFAGQLLHEPTRLRTGGGSHYRVYSPFWRAIESDLENRSPAPAPASLTPPADRPGSEKLADWGLLPVNPDWAGGLRATWRPGETGAHARLANFVESRICGYAERRDLPGVDATSGLSPHLANGEITPAQIIEAMTNCHADASARDRTVFRKEVGWREFSWHLLANEPDLPRANHNRKFDGFPWAGDNRALTAWQRGMTGYPIVDAGMRELWRTGWMHNRVRMVTASFLTKHLMIDWREGEKWFWDTLVDADPASNAASWQWVAGSGADAAPYFRIFNPIIQGEKFDPEGEYVRRHVAELAKMPAKYIHKPWAPPDKVLADAGVDLGETYPKPIVDHQAARNRALAAYDKIKDAA
jgi:deoxyribodipyrimidine photo-lyase